MNITDENAKAFYQQYGKEPVGAEHTQDRWDYELGFIGALKFGNNSPHGAKALYGSYLHQGWLLGMKYIEERDSLPVALPGNPEAEVNLNSEFNEYYN